MPLNSNHRNINLAHQQKSEEREAWHKLVVKIIRLKEGLIEDKLTPKEWKAYCEFMVKTNISYSKEKILHGLKETRELIKANFGFK